jgi:hypothetical protein
MTLGSRTKHQPYANSLARCPDDDRALSACTALPPALAPAPHALVGCYVLHARATTASWRRLPDTLALTPLTAVHGSDVTSYHVRFSDQGPGRVGTSWIGQARGDSLVVGEKAWHGEFRAAPVGLLVAYGVIAIGLWRRGQRNAAIGSTLLIASSLVRLWGAPVASWAGLVLLAVAVGFFWRAFSRPRVAGPAA